MRPRHRYKRPIPNHRILRSQPGMPQLQAHYHPILFSLMLLCGMAELGLTAFLVNAGNNTGTWPNQRYHTLLLLLVFNAAWTVFFATSYVVWMVDNAKHWLANVASSIIWLGTTWVLWGVSAGLFHWTRTGGSCPESRPISRCRQSLTVESLAWTECALVFIALIATCFWALPGIESSSGSVGARRRSIFDSRRFV